MPSNLLAYVYGGYDFQVMIYNNVKERLIAEPTRWLITGVAGFIGSNLLEHLLKLDQDVVGVDNFSTGKPENLEEVRRLVTEKQWGRFMFHQGDVCDLSNCQEICRGVEYVLHQAAIGSVPRSLDAPIVSNENNVTGTLTLLVAARDQKVRRFIYASSSSVYGDHPALPKIEEQIGRPLSPYALTKYVNELYAQVFYHAYGLETIGLRYFNVFGPRQDPEGMYAAVIPKWIAAMIRGEAVYINGTGETSRDFCYVQNAVQMNILAATTTNHHAINQIYNTAVGERTTLNELFVKLNRRLSPTYRHLQDYRPVHREFRKGDVLHSLADIGKAQRLLGYTPTHTIDQGLDDSLAWYMRNTP